MLPIKSFITVGSLRPESFNRMISKALIAVAPKSVILEILEISRLPMCNQDEDEPPPKEWIDFQQRMKCFDAVIFVVPEYNRFVSGGHKKLKDEASGPFGQNASDAQPGAVISVSVGSLGAVGLNHHLHRSLVFLNMPKMRQPENYISDAAKIFEAKGNLNNESSRHFLTDFMKSFVT